MSRQRIMSKIRTQAYYEPMLITLEECGISEFEILPPTGRGHPILKFTHGGGEHRVPIPGSPSSTSKAGKYISNAIRRRVRGLAR